MFEQIVEKFKGINEIKLVYLFGSRASGKSGQMSDYNFVFFG
ncbi:MAG: hypothetical protein UR27_C0007G0034 [Candidatus Peregrinibacteria bacterium GW2011_GWA2_33_10]|nr:MAG: hypothetical protein UR27_C0007G0034 [Candidatus Peregrinibacteria bacterium GW2011_GWA2_33_10]KKP40904.1 MAG: hypothetical protein UR30_C0003G0076 [Candidatus Peregrinibacteria bacterium GW2011_GWC2_33_13]